MARSMTHGGYLEGMTTGEYILRVPARGTGEGDAWHTLPERTRRRLIAGGFAVSTDLVQSLDGSWRRVPTLRGRKIDELADYIMDRVPGIDCLDDAVAWWVRECLHEMDERVANRSSKTRDMSDEERLIAEYGDAYEEYLADGEAGLHDTSRGAPRVFAYLRVSTDAQADAGTIVNQVDAVEAWCEANMIELSDVFTDEGISGSEGIDTRAGLASALDVLEAGDTLLVSRLDRLARDLVLQEQLLATIWRKGAHLVSCAAAETQYLVPDDPSDPSRKLIRTIIGAVAEYERGLIRARTIAGRRRKQSTGGYVGGGVPFGWMAVSGLLVEHPTEHPLIAEAYRMWKAGAKQTECAAWMSAQTGVEWNKVRMHRVLARYASMTEGK